MSAPVTPTTQEQHQHRLEQLFHQVLPLAEWRITIPTRLNESGPFGGPYWYDCNWTAEMTIRIGGHKFHGRHTFPQRDAEHMEFMDARAITLTLLYDISQKLIGFIPPPNGT